jgi:hypothetical protein
MAISSFVLDQNVEFYVYSARSIKVGRHQWNNQKPQIEGQIMQCLNEKGQKVKTMGGKTLHRKLGNTKSH